MSLTPTPERALSLAERNRVARLLARLYRQAAPAQRVRLLAQLLRPVGPLALVAIGAGAFARLMPARPWNGVTLSIADAEHIDAHQVLELALYVEQKSPELFLQLPQLVTDPRLWFGSATGALLWLLLRSNRDPAGPSR